MNDHQPPEEGNTMRNETDLQILAGAFGRLMVAGLNRLSPEAQLRVTDALAAGGQTFALVTAQPYTFRAMLCNASGEQQVELFRVTESDGLH